MERSKTLQASYFFWKNQQLYIDLLVQAYASHDEIVGVQGNRLKVRIASSPVSGKANEHLLKLMAKHFGVPQNRVHLIKGHQSRMKQICIDNPQEHLPAL